MVGARWSVIGVVGADSARRHRDKRTRLSAIAVAFCSLLAVVWLCVATRGADDHLDFRMHDPLQRAGHPDSVKRHAIPSETPHYSMGLVGGGAAVRGEPPWPGEGTWGWDYHGAVLPKRVWLGWLHGRHPRSGLRGYQTDGPKLIHR